MPLFVTETSNDLEDTGPPVTPEGAVPLGQAAGLRWYRADRVPTEGRTPTTDEVSTAMLELPAIRSAKAAARRRIASEVGDLHEIIADQAKQIEALTVMLCRLSAEYLGGTAMTDDQRTRYLTRVETVLGAIETGGLTLRGDVEAADDMLQKTLARTNRINQIIADSYLPQRSRLID